MFLTNAIFVLVKIKLIKERRKPMRILHQAREPDKKGFNDFLRLEAIIRNNKT